MQKSRSGDDDWHFEAVGFTDFSGFDFYIRIQLEDTGITDEVPDYGDVLQRGAFPTEELRQDL